ncbi:MAG: NUDIX domain-containing protein [Planctomycetota bacterium]
MKPPRVSVAVDLVAFGVLDRALRVLLVRRGIDPYRGRWALPGGFVKARESLEEAARRELAEETGLDGVYIEQLYTWGDPRRDPRGRVISVAYLALVPESRFSVRGGSDAAAAAFHDAKRPPALAFDHRRILTLAVDRLRTKAEYSTLPLRLLDEPFTLSEVQEVYEVALGRRLDKRNFRRKVLALDALQRTDGLRREGAHRPARLFRLSPSRPHLLKERGILFPF